VWLWASSSSINNRCDSVAATAVLAAAARSSSMQRHVAACSRMHVAEANSIMQHQAAASSKQQQAASSIKQQQGQQQEAPRAAAAATRDDDRSANTVKSCTNLRFCLQQHAAFTFQAFACTMMDTGQHHLSVFGRPFVLQPHVGSMIVSPIQRLFSSVTSHESRVTKLLSSFPLTQ